MAAIVHVKYGVNAIYLCTGVLAITLTASKRSNIEEPAFNSMFLSQLLKQRPERQACHIRIHTIAGILHLM
jgi:hypothetical protein